MQRYRFLILDEHRLVADVREFPATSDDVAIQLAEGWADVRGGELRRGTRLIKQWRRRTARP